MNPLLIPSKLKYEAIDFNSFTEDDYLPALEIAIAEAKENLEEIKAEKNPTFENTIIKGETLSNKLDAIAEIYYALYSAHCTEKLSQISEKVSELLTNFGNDITLDQKYFEQVKTVYHNTDKSKLSVEERTVLEETYKGFVKNGALLSEDDKNKLRQIDQKLAKLGLSFSENVREATNKFFLVVENEKDLEGMPEAVIEAASEEAKQKGHEGKWVFTLQYPSYIPFMTYCKNRELRRQMSVAAGSKAFKDEFDNSQVVLEIVRLRHERANLLGHKTHADFVLEDRMAQTPEKVREFLRTIEEKSKDAAVRDFKKIQAIQEKLEGHGDLQRYDSAYYSEILKKEELDMDDEMLRPYFKLENVIAGVFQVANKLYGLNFVEDNSIPKYHPDVKTYHVHYENGEYVGLFYADFFPRAEKRPGAWMTTFRNQGLQFGEVKRPFVSIVCNFTKPTATRPSLLTLNEVSTLFHEFGHALHGLLSKCTYKSVAGTNVYWDFVELPSQVMENWVLEKEALDLFAIHYETGEKMPASLIEKVKLSRTFLEGLATFRQLSFGMLDMAWHSQDPKNIKSVEELEEAVMKDYDLYPRDGKSNMSCSFGHLFAGGYSAGYYSYKWAEVLDADAFEFFKEKGIFSREVADRFRENILEKGGSEHPMELYKKFRGKEPSVDALLKRAGLQ